MGRKIGRRLNEGRVYSDPIITPACSLLPHRSANELQENREAARVIIKQFSYPQFSYL